MTLEINVGVTNSDYYQQGVRLVGVNYIEKVKNIQSADLILYHPMNETEGSIANDHSPENNDGAYTGVTLADALAIDGNYCPLFDGANDYNNIYSAALNTDFDGDEGTIMIWGKVSGSGVWTDGAYRRLIELGDNGNNKVLITKTDVSNRLLFEHKSGGVSKQINLSSISPTNWFQVALTWSKTADEVKAYYNGSQTGTTLTGLGTWAGNLGSTTTNIGCRNNSVPDILWNGWETHGVVWKAALSGSKIAELATV